MHSHSAAEDKNCHPAGDSFWHLQVADGSKPSAVLYGKVTMHDCDVRGRGVGLRLRLRLRANCTEWPQTRIRFRFRFPLRLRFRFRAGSTSERARERSRSPPTLASTPGRICNPQAKGRSRSRRRRRRSSRSRSRSTTSRGEKPRRKKQKTLDRCQRHTAKLKDSKLSTQYSGRARGGEWGPACASMGAVARAGEGRGGDAIESRGSRGPRSGARGQLACS